MEQDYIKNELVKFNLPEAAIAQLSKEYMPLTIKGMEDKEGYKKVHEARMVIVRKRNEIEKKRKELKEDAIKFGKAVDTEAKRLTGLLQPIEDHLTKEQKAIDDFKKHQEEEAAQKERQRILERTNLLFEAGCRFNGITYSYGTFMVPQSVVVTLDDAGFEAILAELHSVLRKELEKKQAEEAAAVAEKERLAKEKLAQEVEWKRLEAERKTLAEAEAKREATIQAEAKKLADERAALDAEKKALQDIRDKEEVKKRQLAEIKEAEERATAKAKTDLEEKERLAKDKAEKEVAEKAKKEARRPDKTKLLAWVDQIAALSGPPMKTKEGGDVLLGCTTILIGAVREMRVKIKEL